MGNRITLAVIIFFCTVFSLGAFAVKGSSTGKCSGVVVQDVMQNLDYVGVNFPDRNGFCVEALNDNEAKTACSKAGGVSYLNPHNPQYVPTGSGVDRGISKGFYLCFNTRNNNKQKICNDLISGRIQSRYNLGKTPSASNYVGFEWTGKGTEDGDCLCNHPQADGKVQKTFRECDQEPLLDEAPPEKTAEAEIAPATEVVSTEPSDKLKQCVADHEAKIKKCEEESTAAKKQCSKDKTKDDKDYNDKMKFVTSISDALIQGHAGQGAQAQCAGASLLSSGAGALMKALQASCETDLKACLDSCAGTEKTFKEVCSKSMKSSEVGVEDGSPDEKYVSEYWVKYQKTIQKSVDLCTVGAKKDNDDLKTGINAFNNAQSSAAKCACQLSNAGPPPGIGNCDSLPTTLNCLQTPGIPGCDQPNDLSCALGSASYTTPRCQCMRDGSLTICQAPPGKVPFAFASDLKAINSGNSTGGGSGGGSFGGGGLDLGGIDQTNDTVKADGAGQGSAPGFGTAAGGGGGGGGGSGGGDSGGAAAVGEAGEPVEKNLGLFGMAKSAVSSLFGKGGSAAGKDVRNKNAKAIPDAEKWRPRGLAGTGCKSSQIRCKNETIWEIMNTRYGSAENTFIQKP